MPDSASIQDQLLDLLAGVEIDEHVELAINTWGKEGAELLRGIVRGSIEADDYQRANAAYLLGVLDLPKAADELAQVLAMEEIATIRMSALDGIHHAGGTKARSVLLKIASSGKSAATERVHAVEWLGEIGEDKDADALEKIATKPEEALLAQRVHAAVKAIRYRSGWTQQLDQDGQDDGDDNDPQVG